MDTNRGSGVIQTNGLRRRKTINVNIGGVMMGSDFPIRVQSMTTTNTNHIEATVAQCVRIANAGAHLVRCTAQGVREAKSLRLVKEELLRRGYTIPLVADIHFNPNAALEAVKYVDKVRINPGNFAEPVIQGQELLQDYSTELVNVEERVLPLLELCRQRDVAVRIGVNHGSLSRRITSRYGDTPMGMAQSAMEFLRVFAKHNFQSLVVSMKSSNTRVMVYATRLLVQLMEAENMYYPLHLGVTEAGEGEDGRIKSAVGIGALLADGMGDTIRVSLTEEPELEIPEAIALANHFLLRESLPELIEPDDIPINPIEFNRRTTIPVLHVGGNNHPVVVANLMCQEDFTSASIEAWGWKNEANGSRWVQADDRSADLIFIGNCSPIGIPGYENLPLIGASPQCMYGWEDIRCIHSPSPGRTRFIDANLETLTPENLDCLRSESSSILLIREGGPGAFNRIRAAIFRLIRSGIKIPVVVGLESAAGGSNFQLLAAADCGPLFIDGLGDGLMLSASNAVPQSTLMSTAFGILQAARARFTRTEFISCPGCGRTLFGLNQTLIRVKERTQHLRGLKIAVMGCIVNGPGEMADADYGYVGAGPGRVSLYKGKDVVKRNVPEDDAVDELVELIRRNGDWADAT